MNTDEKDVLGLLKKTIELISQGIIVIAFFIIVLLFVNRLVVCSFYGLPITYYSLDPLRALPLLFIFMFIIICVLIFSPNVRKMIDDNYEYTEKNNEIHDSAPLTNRNSLVQTIKDFFIGKSASKRNFLQSFIYKFSNKIHALLNSDKQPEESATMRFIYSLALSFLPPASCIIQWISGPYTIVEEHKSIINRMDYEILVVIFLGCLQIWTIHLFTKAWGRRVNHLSNVAEKEKSINIKAAKTKTKIQLVVFLFLLLCMLSLWASFCESVSLLHTQHYDLIYIQEKEQITPYAIILNLDEYYILEPIKENGAELTIYTNQYMYKEKDGVLISKKNYDRVIINRSEQKDFENAS